MNKKSLYNLLVFIITTILFVLYQQNIFSVKVDFVSQLLLVVIILVVLLALVSV